MKFSTFCRLVVSEKDGTPSFGRVAFGFVIFVSMACLAFFARAALKNPAVDFRGILEGLAVFIVSVGSVTYGVNKVSMSWGANQKVSANEEKQS